MTDAVRPSATVSWAGAPIVSSCGGGTCTGAQAANANNKFNYGSSEPTRTVAGQPGAPAGANGFRCSFNGGAERGCSALTNGSNAGEVQTGSGTNAPTGSPSQNRLGTPTGAGNANGAENTLEVWAVDAAGNLSASPASASFTYDIVAPTVTRVSPSAGTIRTNDTSSRTLFFSSDEATSSFSCSVNSTVPGDYSGCTGGGTGGTTGSHTLNGPLAEGTYAVRVRGSDLATAANVTSAGVAPLLTVIVDLTAPTTAITGGPSDGGTSSNKSPEFTFATTGEPDGTNTFECNLDSQGWVPCGSVMGNTAASKAYSDLGDGEHTFMVRATDEATNQGPSESRTWTIETNAPTVDFTGPDARTGSTDAEIGFESAKAGTTFECRLDSTEESDFEACTSPVQLTGLGEGDHAFDVRATDGLGNAGIYSYEWEIDLTAPVMSITSGPADPTNATSATFVFSSSEPARTDAECSVDGGSFQDCQSGDSFSGLAEGAHAFEVRGTDDVGNEGDADTYEWNVDTTAPQVAINSGPGSRTAASSAEFRFDSASSDAAGFECKLDNGAYAPCSAPQNYGSLSEGSHDFAVRAVDQAGNTGTAAQRTWSVDQTGPSVSIDSGPTSGEIDPTATFAVSTTSADLAGLRCRIDSGSFAACSSPVSYDDLEPGFHLFRVRGVDDLGNEGQIVEYGWTVGADDGGPLGDEGKDKVAPTIERVNAPVKVSRNGRLIVATVTCPEGTCTPTAGTAKLKVGKKSYRAKLKMPKRIEAGTTVEAKVVLSKRGRKALAAAGRGHAEAGRRQSPPTTASAPT